MMSAFKIGGKSTWLEQSGNWSGASMGMFLPCAPTIVGRDVNKTRLAAADAECRRKTGGLSCRPCSERTSLIGPPGPYKWKDFGTWRYGGIGHPKQLLHLDGRMSTDCRQAAHVTT
jgi:hypothetical protein